MSISIKEFYQAVRSTAFPVIGKRVGDFPLYDSLLAGCADRASHGRPVLISELPLPDQETLKFIEELRGNHSPTNEEQLFLQYFDMLESLRMALIRELPQ